MTTKTEQNSLYLPINQESFDEILNGTKDKEYRAIGPNTVTMFIEHKEVEGETQLLYNQDLISEEDYRLHPNDFMFYNKGVFAYMPKEIKYIDFGVGYKNEKDRMTVEVEYISFEPGKDMEGNFAIVSYDKEGKPYKDDNGEFALWNIVFHLGDVVEKDLKKNREDVE